MKQGAHTVAEQTGGRFTLGIGVSSPVIVSKIRGIPYGRPLAYMRSYLEAMEASRYTSVMPPEPVPVVLAALGPRMLELAAERTDGAHPYNTTPEHTAFARSVMGPDAQLCVEQKVMLTTDAQQARATGAKVMKFYTRAPGYRDCWKRLGFDDDDIDGLSDRFVDAMVAWGDADAIERRLAEHADAGATQVCVQVLHPSYGVGTVDYEVPGRSGPGPLRGLGAACPMEDLAGRVAVVTGGASGIGRSAGRALRGRVHAGGGGRYRGAAPERDRAEHPGCRRRGDRGGVRRGVVAVGGGAAPTRSSRPTARPMCCATTPAWPPPATSPSCPSSPGSGAWASTCGA